MTNIIKEVCIIKPFHTGYNLYHIGEKLTVRRSSNSRILLVHLTDTSVMTLNEMMTLGYIEKTELYRNNWLTLIMYNQAAHKQ